MKNSIKLALAAVAVAAATSAQAQYNGDLIIGLTSGSGNDLVYDLGSASSLYSGETWSLGSLLSGPASTMQWGVIGNTLNGTGKNTDNTIWTTTAGSSATPNVPSTTAYGTMNSSMGLLTTSLTLGAGNYAQVPANPSPANGTSWYQQTVSGYGPTAYVNVYENPNVTGVTSDTLWSVDDKTTLAVTELGGFALGSDGTLSYTAVPEPSTYGILAGFGLLALSLRRQLAPKA